MKNDAESKASLDPVQNCLEDLIITRSEYVKISGSPSVAEELKAIAELARALVALRNA